MVTYNNEGKITTDAVPTVGLAAPTTPPTGGPAERYIPGGGFPPGDNFDYTVPIRGVGKAILENNPAKVLPTVSNERQFHLLIVNDFIYPMVSREGGFIINQNSTTYVVKMTDMTNDPVAIGHMLRGASWSSVVIIGIKEYDLVARFPSVYAAIMQGLYRLGTKIAEIA